MNFHSLLSPSFSNQVHREENFNLEFNWNEIESTKYMDKRLWFVDIVNFKQCFLKTSETAMCQSKQAMFSFNKRSALNLIISPATKSTATLQAERNWCASMRTTDLSWSSLSFSTEINGIKGHFLCKCSNGKFLFLLKQTNLLYRMSQIKTTSIST